MPRLRGEVQIAEDIRSAPLDDITDVDVMRLTPLDHGDQVGHLSAEAGHISAMRISTPSCRCRGSNGREVAAVGAASEPAQELFRIAHRWASRSPIAGFHSQIATAFAPRKSCQWHCHAAGSQRHQRHGRRA